MRVLKLEFLGMVLAGVIAVALPAVAIAGHAADTGKAGTISGKVVDRNGNPVGGAIVRVMRLPKGAGMPPGGGPGGGPGNGGPGGPGGPGGFGGPGGGPGGPGPQGHIKVKAGQSVWIKHMLILGVTKTAADGTFTLTNAPAGKYAVMAMKRREGFGHSNKPLVVKAGRAVDAGTITLRKGPRGPGGPPGPGGPGGPGGPNGPGGPPPGQ